MKIFISYRREDSAGHSGRLHDSLQAHFGPENVFMDLDDIDSGQNFAEAIQSAIRSSDVVLAIIGKEWLTCSSGGTRRIDMPTDFVRTEIGMALAHGVPVIPVLVQGAPMPLAPSLPEPLKQLASHDAHDLSDERWSYDVGRLIDATEKLAGRRPPSKRWPLFAAIAAVIAIAAVAAAAFFFLRTGQPAVTLAGNWSADVTYDWGANYTERFVFKVDGDAVLGTASFLRVPRGIVDGSLAGDRLVFQTRTEEVRGDSNPLPVTHHYRGTITGDTIAFTMQTEGGSSTVPVEFTATRDARAGSK